MKTQISIRGKKKTAAVTQAPWRPKPMINTTPMGSQPNKYSPSCFASARMGCIQLLISTPPMITVPRTNKCCAGLEGTECDLSCTPPINGTTSCETVQCGGTKMLTPPMRTNTSTTASSPGLINASRKSSSHPPMNAVVSAPRKTDLPQRRLLLPRSENNDACTGSLEPTGGASKPLGPWPVGAVPEGEPAPGGAGGKVPERLPELRIMILAPTKTNTRGTMNSQRSRLTQPRGLSNSQPPMTMSSRARSALCFSVR